MITEPHQGIASVGDDLAGGVFVLKDPKTLVPMQPASFAKEDDFQQLLADFPSLLSGDLIDAQSPRRWLLLAREKSVPSEEAGAARWSVDHLFVDQDGVPTFVEVKRQSDTRLRREVVGQMLDYAANAVVYWPIHELREEFAKNCRSKGLDTENQVRDLLGLEDVETFWQTVKTNLQAGRVRMLFVADRIPDELKRIVEFLNAQMDPAEVLALELRQYEGEGLKTLVPVVYGQTEAAQQKKSVGGTTRQWDEQAIFADLEDRYGVDVVRVARRIAEWMKIKGDRVWYGRGARDGSMVLVISREGQDYFPLSMWTYGKVEIAFQHIMKGSVFKDEVKRRELSRRLNEIEGINLPVDAITRRPSILLSNFVNEKRLTMFLSVMDWLVNEMRSG